MCSRYFLERTPQELDKHFNLEFPKKRYGEVRPSNAVPIITRKGVEELRWGIHTKEHFVINARAETIEKWRLEPCLVPMTGFIEWDAQRAKRRFNTNRPIFCFAGLTNGEEYVIITTQANETVRAVHERMPLILERSAEAQWLENPDENLLTPYPGEQTIIIKENKTLDEF